MYNMYINVIKKKIELATYEVQVSGLKYFCNFFLFQL